MSLPTSDEAANRLGFRGFQPQLDRKLDLRYEVWCRTDRRPRWAMVGSIRAGRLRFDSHYGFERLPSHDLTVEGLRANASDCRVLRIHFATFEQPRLRRVVSRSNVRPTGKYPSWKMGRMLQMNCILGVSDVVQ